MLIMNGGRNPCAGGRGRELTEVLTRRIMINDAYGIIKNKKMYTQYYNNTYAGKVLHTRFYRKMCACERVETNGRAHIGTIVVVNALYVLGRSFIRCFRTGKPCIGMLETHRNEYHFILLLSLNIST